MTDMSILTGILFATTAMACWGTADFFAVKSARRTSATSTFFWSQLVSVLLYSLMFFLFFRMPILSYTSLALIFVLTISNIIGFLAFYKGLKVGKVGVVSPIVNAWSLVAVSLAILFLGESLSRFQPLAIILVIVGAVFTSFKLKDLRSLNLKNAEVGVGYALAAFFSFGIGFTIIGMLVREINWFIPVYLMKILQMPLLLGYSGVTRQRFSFPRRTLFWILMIGVLETIAFSFYGLGLSYAYTSLLAPIVAAAPVVTVILARIFFRERFDASQAIGISSVLVGIVLLSL